MKDRLFLYWNLTAVNLPLTLSYYTLEFVYRPIQRLLRLLQSIKYAITSSPGITQAVKCAITETPPWPGITQAVKYAITEMPSSPGITQAVKWAIIEMPIKYVLQVAKTDIFLSNVCVNYNQRAKFFDSTFYKRHLFFCVVSSKNSLPQYFDR